MYTFNPKKYGTSWAEICRFNPLNRFSATRQPGWFGNESVTFNANATPYAFMQMFVDIGKIQTTRTKHVPPKQISVNI